ncbi:MAG: hypothetical protein E7668_02295 [Ruminococcaceae bacterium]|nr:hypothetical protein [Oscillospiraceae bacterium]
MESCIVHMWETVFARFFCPETELLYEFITEKGGNAWTHLPPPETIRQQIPNPCGWGTGMEDSVLNGGTALDALVTYYNRTQDRRVKPTADALFRGLLRCADGESGFVARSVSPADSKAHYIESSRDQYTHWVCAAVRLYDSPLCDPTQKEAIRRVLTAIARRCEQQVTPEHDYHLLREDGTRGKVNRLWGELALHEWLRLPLFYLAAFHVTEDPHWQALYQHDRNEALARSRFTELPKYRMYCFLQMQYSLRTLYDLDPDPTIRPLLCELMTRLAEHGEQTAIANSREYRKPCYRKALADRFRPWNEVEPLRQGLFEGYLYDNPAQSERRTDFPTFYPVRDIGEGAIIAALCPNRSCSADLTEAVLGMAQTLAEMDFPTVYAPLYLACAALFGCSDV